MPPIVNLLQKGKEIRHDTVQHSACSALLLRLPTPVPGKTLKGPSDLITSGSHTRGPFYFGVADFSAPHVISKSGWAGDNIPVRIGRYNDSPEVPPTCSNQLRPLLTRPPTFVSRNI